MTRFPCRDQNKALALPPSTTRVFPSSIHIQLYFNVNGGRCVFVACAYMCLHPEERIKSLCLFLKQEPPGKLHLGQGNSFCEAATATEVLVLLVTHSVIDQRLKVLTEKSVQLIFLHWP